MKSKWVILALIILMYLPVSIDATILHVAVPTLASELATKSNQLLWIIDIYSLVMAGMLLPMGALGDRVGFKKLVIIGLTIFGLASLFAALSTSAMMLIMARALLAIGAAMILPATLSGIRKTFEDEKERAMALGIWTTIGVSGAALGPLIGGYLLSHFHWGVVFLINIPLVLITIIGVMIVIPKQVENTKQQWPLGKAIFLTIAVLLIVYGLKSSLKLDGELRYSCAIGILGITLLTLFIKKELKSAAPMIDFHLFKIKALVIGTIIAMVVMVTLVGFELLVTQELQLVYHFTPLKAGIFIAPLMLSSCIGGSIAGWLSSRVSFRILATAGIGISSLCFLGLASVDFITQTYWVWGLFILLGLSLDIALLSSTSAIMSAVSSEQSSAAGAIEGIAYELGAGFGVIIFGLMISIIYSYHIDLPTGLSQPMQQEAKSSITQAFYVASQLDVTSLSEQLISAAKLAFSKAHQVILISAGSLLLLLTLFIWQSTPSKINHH
ncbi:DHA2 family multidrug resistance protein-like MFS transporter [Orbus hercynius]|uniref:DHA2 family multidrug resistance protein-like MFS transporter n=1 Tax=Orbus hercynius TaxID=593135 RepID=A0A495RBV2_9GAMM|nr:MFS transporter [Orbus hercynius]RKS84811.1 DHA2 family multidrug resistance protein-like MFS transporter [Orbus hercynius]